MTVAFDSLAYAQRLESGGVSRTDAATHAAAARDYIMTEMTTRADLAELKADFAALAGATKSDIALLAEKMERQTLQMTIRLGGIVATGIAILAAVVKFGA